MAVFGLGAVVAVIAASVQLVCVAWLVTKAKQKGVGIIFQEALVVLSFRREDDPLDADACEKIAELLLERRSKCGRMMLQLLWVACSGGWTFLHTFRRWDDPEDNTLVHELSLVATLIMPVSLMVLVLCPSLVAAEWQRQLACWVYMCSFCCAALTPMPPVVENKKTVLATLGALLTGGIDLRFRTVLVPHIIMYLCFVVSQSWANDEVSMFVQSVAVDAILVVMSLMACWFAQGFMEATARQEVAASLGKCHQSAVTSLLGMMCDAVVDLDEQFRLKEHNDKLAVMLMHGNGRSLEGEQLNTFTADDISRQRLDAMLHVQGQTASSDNTASTEPGMMSVRFRDSMTGPINTVVYHVPYRSLCGSTHHLIGIREETDFCMGSGFPVGQASTSAETRPAATLRPALAERLQQVDEILGPCQPPRSQSSRSSRSSRSSNGSSHRGGIRNSSTEQPEYERSLEVYLSDGLPIRWMAEELRQEFELEIILDAPCIEFGQFLSDGGAALLQQLNDIVDTASSSTSEGLFLRRLGQWELLPSNSSANIESSYQIANGTSPSPTSRSLFVNFLVPILKDEEGLPFVAVAIGRHLNDPARFASQRPIRSRSLGTAATSTPQHLCGDRSNEVTEAIHALRGSPTTKLSFAAL